MGDTYTAVDLSKLPAPAIVEVLDFATLYAARLAMIQNLLPDFDATVESDPAVKILQISVMQELLLRARINDAARACMVASAQGPDLDQLAAIFDVTRLLIAAADPAAGTAAVYESDDDLRRRVTLAPEGYSVAGPTGAYIYHTLSADGAVLDASAISPSPGQVLVTVLSRVGNGTASADLLAAVTAHVSAEQRRPLTDQVTVQSAAIVNYTVVAALTFFIGPDAAIVQAQAQAQLAEVIGDGHRLGRDVTRAAIIAALKAPGVQNIALAQPAADIPIDRTQAAFCTSVTITNAGVGE